MKKIISEKTSFVCCHQYECFQNTNSCYYLFLENYLYFLWNISKKIIFTLKLVKIVVGTSIGNRYAVERIRYKAAKKLILFNIK